MSIVEEWEKPGSASLRELIAGKLLDQRRALAIIRQVLEALVATHATGAVHGDIKPENILVATVGKVDRVQLVGSAGATLGNVTTARDPRYAAPESALGKIDARADIYSVGAVLFELLTGHPPFWAEDADALRRLHAYAPRQTLKQRAPELSFVRALEELVAMALTKKREGRLQSATDMIAVLDHAVQSIEELASPEPESSSPRRRKANDSLLLLAKDLMPSSSESAAHAAVVPFNVGRQVPELPRSTRALDWLRNALGRVRLVPARLVDKLGMRATLAKLGRRQRRILAGLTAALALAVAIGVWTCGGTSESPAQVAKRARALVAEGKPQQAIELLERVVAAHPDNGAAHAALGEAQLALGHHREALAAYESGILATPALAAEPGVVASLSRIADSDDAVIAISALELIALRCGSQGADVIARHASGHGVADVRRHAAVLADRVGTADRIDRVASWMLDLEQASSCEQRRTAIDKLARSADPRAVPALRRAKTHKCVERDASAAIKRITAASKAR